jgi:exonuclease SbcD
MSLRILHTSDWHLGQTFHDYERTSEHQRFLSWLVDTICINHVDVLLISGDVFDVANPSTQASQLYFNFLREVTLRQPNLQVLIIAGNHDSPGRLEAPKALLEAFNVNVVGMVEFIDNKVDLNKIIIPLIDKYGNRVGLCLAIPFVRLGDYPTSTNESLSYEQGVAKLYQEAYEYASNQLQPGEFIIAMGHLHTAGATTSVDDKSERLILGGLNLISSDAFNPGIIYTALGHIHKAQCLDTARNIRYAGSPLPMSFSENNYTHKVYIADISSSNEIQVSVEKIPVTVNLLRIPKEPLPITNILPLLESLPDAQEEIDDAPFLEVRVLMNEPEPSLKSSIENAVKGKHVRLAKISVTYPASSEFKDNDFRSDDLEQVKPVDIFKRRYNEVYKNDIPDELVDLFNVVYEEVNQQEAIA